MVVAIISILAAIAVPNLIQAFQRAKARKANVDLRNIATSLGIYSSDQGYMPDTADYEELMVILKDYQPHIDELPLHDPWGNFYVYARTGKNEYTLKSLGKDRAVSNPAEKGRCNADDDLIVINGTFVALN